MPELETIVVNHLDTTVLVDTGTLWWSKSHPFRVTVEIAAVTNAVPQDQVAVVHLPFNWVEVGKVRPDAADVQVVKGSLGAWELAPTYSYVEDNFIVVKFKVLDEIQEADTYEIYYGDTELANTPTHEQFVDYTYAGFLNFNSIYTSVTNPTQDWLFNEGTVEASKQGVKAFIDINAERVKLYGVRGPDGGMARVTLNGLEVFVIDMYSSTLSTEAEIFAYELENPGKASMMIEVLPDKNVSSNNHTVRLTGIRYDTFAIKLVGTEEIYPKVSWISSTGAA